MGDHDLSDHLHPFFTFFLLFQQFSFARHVSAVALGGNIFSKGRYGFAGDNITADGTLDGNFKHLSGDFIAQSFAGQARSCHGIFPVYQLRQGIHPFSIDQNIHFNKVGLPEIDDIVIKRAVSLGDGFKPVVEIIDNFRQRYFKDHFEPITG